MIGDVDVAAGDRSASGDADRRFEAADAPSGARRRADRAGATAVSMRSSLVRRVMIGAPYLWLLIFFLVPFAIVLKLSFSEARIAVPPYGPTWDTLEGVRAYFANLSFENYAFIFDDALYATAYLNSLQIAAVSTVIALLIGYPMAYAIARAPAHWRAFLLLLVILPFWTSFLIRVYAWIGILKPEASSTWCWRRSD